METTKRSGETHNSFVCSSPYVISHSYHIFCCVPFLFSPPLFHLNYTTIFHLAVAALLQSLSLLLFHNAFTHFPFRRDSRKKLDLTNVQSMQNAFFQMAREIMMGNTLDVTIHITRVECEKLHGRIRNTLMHSEHILWAHKRDSMCNDREDVCACGYAA